MSNKHHRLARLFKGIIPQTPDFIGLECLDFVVCQIKRREVYRHLSNTADRLVHAGDILHDISVKYG